MLQYRLEDDHESSPNRVTEPILRGPIKPTLTSFRDPGGALCIAGDRVFRFVNAAGAADLSAFLDARSSKTLIEKGSIVGTRALSEDEREHVSVGFSLDPVSDGVVPAMLLEHERIAFPSFPYEWPPELLYAAGMLTLELARALLPDGIGLKDATPYNVLFRGPDPVFIDVLSFERREPGDPIWLPYAQFVRTFLLPLLANKYYGLSPDQILLTRRDGLEPEEVYRWLPAGRRLRPPFLSLVSLPTWLAHKGKADKPGLYKKTLRDPSSAEFIVGSLLKRLQRTLKKLEPGGGKTSVWSDYMTSNNNYSAEQFDAKKKYVEDVLAEFRPKRVLDVGCNTGLFSSIAARAGASVVGIDYDPVVVGNTWRRARAEHLNILPLVVNLTRPTPGAGWRNGECPSFLDRAAGAFDGVLMLAVVHHMLVTERIPLNRIADLAADLTTDLLVVEFIAPEDSMFRRLTRGREELHRGLNASVFENAFGSRFDIVRSVRLEGTFRCLYVMRRKKS